MLAPESAPDAIRIRLESTPLSHKIAYACCIAAEVYVTSSYNLGEPRVRVLLGRFYRFLDLGADKIGNVNGLQLGSTTPECQGRALCDGAKDHDMCVTSYRTDDGSRIYTFGRLTSKAKARQLNKSSSLIGVVSEDQLSWPHDWSLARVVRDVETPT